MGGVLNSLGNYNYVHAALVNAFNSNTPGIKKNIATFFGNLINGSKFNKIYNFNDDSFELIVISASPHITNVMIFRPHVKSDFLQVDQLNPLLQKFNPFQFCLQRYCYLHYFKWGLYAS